MSTILAIIIILIFLKIARDGLFWLWLWQVKEYRMDRMKSYLRENKSVSIKKIDYLFILFLILILYFKPVILIYLVLLFFAYAFYQILMEVKNRTLKRPVFTFRVLLTFFTIIVFCLLFAIYWIPVFAGMTEIRAVRIVELLLFIYIITPILISVIILSTNPLFNFQKKRIIKKASLKMRGLKKVKVIGITGSYGKTSTKEFLDTILSQKYKVVKTEGNNNTNIGVAMTVLNKVNDDYDYFICEMGAYKIGEIAEMCAIVKPEIGILTGINEQHLDLFGSIKNTRKAKFELIKSLPENGVAVLNGDNKYIELGIKNQELRVKNIKYFSISNAGNIKVHQDCVKFIYKNQKFKLNLLGKHYVENILSAIITAESLRINLEKIAQAVAKIKPSEFMMRKLDGFNNSVFIDDSYSANPDGVIVALDYLDEAYRDYQKIIVFPGIIELGEKSDEVHRKLFSKIDEICDVAYVMSRKFIKLKVYKVDDENKCEFIFEEDFEKVVGMLKNNLDEKTVVLFESRGAGVVMGKIIL